MSPLIRTWFFPLLIAAAVAVIARAAIVQVFAIPSGSMMPTLQAGDQILVTPYQFPWLERRPRRGHVVVFRRLDGTAGFFVKRVVGVPGDSLEIERGQVFVDGHALAEPYLLSESAGGELRPEIVPSESYFLMGDHRDDSIDSRFWGFVPRSAIVGRARVVFWSAGGRSAHQSADALVATRHSHARGKRVRWNRIFTIVR